MFFFLDIPKWVMALMAAAVVTILGVVIWLLRSNLTVSGGAVEYMSEYEAGSGKSTSSAKRNERTAAPKTGFELKPGQQPHNTVINKKGSTSNTASVPSQSTAPPVSDDGRGRGGRN
jgi:hypothetical protein